MVSYQQIATVLIYSYSINTVTAQNQFGGQFGGNINQNFPHFPIPSGTLAPIQNGNNNHGWGGPVPNNNNGQVVVGTTTPPKVSPSPVVVPISSDLPKPQPTSTNPTPSSNSTDISPGSNIINFIQKQFKNLSEPLKKKFTSFFSNRTELFEKIKKAVVPQIKKIFDNMVKS